MRPKTAVELPPMWSWQDFLDRAAAPATADNARARQDRDGWAGSGFQESLRLATDGWAQALPETDVSIAALRERTGRRVRTTVLEPRWDVTGSEVDVGAFLAGVPECMVDAVPQQVTTRGRVVTLLVPAVCGHQVPTDHIRHRGLALAAFCSAIVTAGHSVEVWSGWGTNLPDGRIAAVARVVSPAEPLDLGRLIFAMAHPAMLRRLWFAVWETEPEPFVRRLLDANYGRSPFTCFPEDLPENARDAYVLPDLDQDEQRWETLDSALAWCQEVFTELGLIRAD
ncbi:hypothetical protein RM844_29875 [Streptomyces sp. DSM 44915]|uniref:DUF7192 domain-containing protein n=1 Tax=Streptomyces chisholmiae TaxID=3075540 RepID=A0ABU2K234_9ACTN|nr:hypothetical protein [Streptomyces sp. DSM 44915]MDT0270488.1 hypothetical protein [Streptomyces sp. DSM 44915]